jgi:hypothetical protein
MQRLWRFCSLIKKKKSFSRSVRCYFCVNIVNIQLLGVYTHAGQYGYICVACMDVTPPANISARVSMSPAGRKKKGMHGVARVDGRVSCVAACR